MKSITMITCSMITAMFAASPAFSADKSFRAEFHTRLNPKKPIVKILPTIQEEPTPTELPPKVESPSFTSVNYKGLKSSESMRLCLVSDIHGTHLFDEPLKFLTSDGRLILTAITSISIGSKQTFKMVVSTGGTHEENDAKAHKYFADIEAFKEWLNRINEGIVD